MERRGLLYLSLAAFAALALAAASVQAEGLYGVTGQKCDFENSTNPGCGWKWKQTEHGFRVVTGQEIASLQQNVKGLSGPAMDANNNTQGERPVSGAPVAPRVTFVTARHVSRGRTA